jgi:hypothetical protein
MYKKLRVACTVIATLFLVAIVPAGSIWDMMGFAVCGVGAGLFFVLMLYFKQSQLFQEEKNNPNPPSDNQTSIDEPSNHNDETPIDEKDEKDEKDENKESKSNDGEKDA